MKESQYRLHYELSGKHWWYVSTTDFFSSLVRKHVPKGESVLDAGCGTGALLESLKEDYSCSGIDYSDSALEFCRLRGIGDVTKGLVEAMPFESGSFGAVVSLDVLYHKDVSDDVAGLKEMDRVLKPGGHVFLQLPAYEWLRSEHDAVAGTARRYNVSRVRGLIAKCGLKTVRTGYRVSLVFPLAVLQRKVLGGRGSDLRPANPALDFVLKKVMSLENLLLKGFDMPFGLSVIAVAYKEK